VANDPDDDDSGPIKHPLLLAEICLAIGIILLVRLTTCEGADTECGSRRVAFFLLGLPMLSIGTFFSLMSFLSARAACLTVATLWGLLLLFSVIVASEA
jgi:hypothetical protein